ncbi:MAG TPA: hypothetical protein PKM88_05035 [bacterium]|nr:hypothetical protein [bacterium]
MALTELAAATAFARGWNRLDPAEFAALLAPEAQYASQLLPGSVAGPAAIAAHLREQMAASVRTQTQVRAELGRSTAGWPDRDCVILRPLQNQIMTVGAVLFTLAPDGVARVDVLLPDLLAAVGTGIFPI